MGWHTYFKKAFLYASVLTIEELRKFIGKSRIKQPERLMECIIYIPLSSNVDAFVVREKIIYLHWRGAFSVARFDLSSNTKAFLLWDE